MVTVKYNPDTDRIIHTRIVASINPWEQPHEWISKLGWRDIDLERAPWDAIQRAKAGYKLFKKRHTEDNSTPEMDELRMKQYTSITMHDADFSLGCYEFPDFTGITSPIM